MSKKLIALAVAATLSAPAFADNANVTIYGKAILNVEAVSNDKSTSEMRVQTNASRFGVKGSEDLGEGLKAVYQYEVEMDADGSGNTVTATGTGTPEAATYKSTPSGLGKTRNSGVGIEGGFGKVILGIWDTPYKLIHNKVELFDNTTSFTTTKMIGRTANGKDYNTRQKNSVTYWSPNFAGAQLIAAYAADETTNRKNFISLGGTYELDALYVAAAYESRPDQTTATTTDTALRAVARYSLGDFWVGGVYESLKVNDTVSTNYTQSNYELVGAYKMGPHNLSAAYVKAGASSTVDTAASMVSLRYGYNFSKRTELFAAYSNLKNEASVNYALAHAAYGATESVAGVGLIHSF